MVKIFFKPIWLLLIFSFLIFRLQIDFPVILDEAKESYTAYSIIKTGRDTNGDLPGLFFRSDNNYLSSLGVYLRIPTVYFWGLTNLGIRLPSIIFGLLTIYVFYLVSKLFFKETSKITLATALFFLSPFLIQLNIFDLGMTLALFFAMLSFYFFIKQNHKLFLLTLVLAVLSHFSSLPFILILLVFERFRVGGVRAITATLFIAVFFFLSSLRIFPELAGYLKRETVVQDMLPESYTYLIDRRLSFGQTYSSPLITDYFNFNRIAHNKPFYALNEFFKAFISPLNYEKLVAPFQSQTILSKETVSSQALPKFFFWEIPAIFIGLILLLKRKRSEIVIFTLGALVSVFIFKGNSLGFFLPIAVFSEVVLIFWLMDVLKPVYFKATVLFIVVVMFFSYVSFFDLLWNHKFLWFNEHDLRQYQIWTTLTNEDLKENKIIVTDRLGEPVNYYLFYKNIDPRLYFKERKLGVITSAGIRRIEKVGNVEFKAFKYWESPRASNEIWVGLAGEFVGGNRKFEEIESVVDGKIFKRIKDVKQENKFIGNELWFVRTTL